MDVKKAAWRRRRVLAGLQRNCGVDRDYAKVGRNPRAGAVIEIEPDLGLSTYLFPDHFKIALEVVPVFLPAELYAANVRLAVGYPQRLRTEHSPRSTA